MKGISKSLICLLITQFLALPMLQAAHLELDDRTIFDQSKVVVVGEVISQNSYWDEHHTSIWTRSIVQIQHVLKGEIATGTITVDVIGGEIGDIGLVVSDQPTLEIGENALLFLEKDQEGRNVVVNGEVGKDSVVKGVLVNRAVPLNSFLTEWKTVNENPGK